MRDSNKIVIIAIIFGFSIWLLDSVVDYYFYYNKTITQLAVTNIPPHEIYIRAVGIFFFLLFGIVLMRMFNRMNEISDGLHVKVRELNCLYELSEIVRKNPPIEDVLQKTVNIIPLAWQHPETTSARIIYENMEFRSENFHNKELKLSRDIIIDSMRCGCIEIHNSGGSINPDNIKFMDEETDVLNVIAEITEQFIERKITEQTRIESEAKLRTLVNTLPDLVALKDDSGVYIKCNLKYERFIGAKRTDVIGKTDYDFLGKELADRFREQEIATINSGHMRIDETEITYADDGHREIVEIIRGPIYNPDGSLMGLVFIGRDVTKRKELEIDLFKGKLVAEESSQAKGAFLAKMSHELRTPLSLIIGYSDILNEEEFGNLNNRQKEFMGNIKSNANHVLELINNILDNSKLESGTMAFEPEIFNMKELVKEVIALITPLARTKSIAINSTADFEELQFCADRTKIKQIMYNLLSNAIKFTARNGTINIHSMIVNNDMQISITDSGIGIPGDKLTAIFEPFRQISLPTSGQYKGAGLGLSIVRQFVEMHKGKIIVESEPGRGSTFTFTIPQWTGHITDEIK